MPSPPSRSALITKSTAPVDIIAGLIHDFIRLHGLNALEDHERLKLLAHSIVMIAPPLPEDASDPFAQHDYEHHI